MRGVYEMSDDLDIETIVASICDNLHGKIRATEESMLLLRIMEFCGVKDGNIHPMFKVMAEKFNVPEQQFNDYVDFVSDKATDRVLLLQPEGFDGQLKTLLMPHSGSLIFTYNGDDKVLLNDVPVLPGAYQVWLQSSVLKGKNGHPVYYSSILAEYNKKNGKGEEDSQQVEFSGRDINFRFPNSDNGMHNLNFTLHSGELLAIMGGSGTGKTTLLSILNGSLIPQEGHITINGHDISEQKAKDLIGFVPQDDLLIIPKPILYRQALFRQSVGGRDRPSRHEDPQRPWPRRYQRPQGRLSHQQIHLWWSAQTTEHRLRADSRASSAVPRRTYIRSVIC